MLFFYDEQHFNGHEIKNKIQTNKPIRSSILEIK